MSAKKIIKTCTSCGETKHEITGFTEIKGVRPMKFHSECRICRAKAKAEERKTQHAAMESARRRRCPCCNELKPLSAFSADQLRYTVGKCKACKPYKPKETAPESPPRVSKNPWESLGLEYRNRKVYDPYQAASRYEGSRT